jgi:folate-dependent phosphoribosylglycinamide formyltransferase PurN
MSASSSQSASNADTPKPARIAVLIAGGPLANMLVNGLADRFGRISVLREEPEPKLAIIRRRARLIGWAEALGQAAFGIAQKFISRRSAARLAAIWEEHGLDPRPNTSLSVREVGSVNTETCRTALRELAPDVVVVYGTRIIKRETLQCTAAPFINYHAGLNPKYRGQNGAYWARSQNDLAHAGVTIHLVDEGVDTGEVLYQAATEFSAEDNIATYQHRQMATALPLIIRAIEDALARRLAPRRVELPSRQWFHPTLWGYVRTGVLHGVW